MNAFFERIDQAIQINDTIKQRGSCEDVDYECIVPMIQTIKLRDDELGKIAQESMGAAIEGFIGEEGTENKTKKMMESTKAKLVASAAKNMGGCLAKFQKEKVAPKPTTNSKRVF